MGRHEGGSRGDFDTEDGVRPWIGRQSNRCARVVGRCEYLLIDVVGITILAVLCGADDFVAVETFAVGRHEWLQQFFELPNGVLVHDTFSRVLGLIDPQQFSAGQRAFATATRLGLKTRAAVAVVASHPLLHRAMTEAGADGDLEGCEPLLRQQDGSQAQSPIRLWFPIHQSLKFLLRVMRRDIHARLLANANPATENAQPRRKSMEHGARAQSRHRARLFSGIRINTSPQQLDGPQQPVNQRLSVFNGFPSRGRLRPGRQLRNQLINVSEQFQLCQFSSHTNLRCRAPVIRRQFIDGDIDLLKLVKTARTWPRNIDC